MALIEPMRLSPSAIMTHMKCPREFYYSYILRLPQPTSIHLLKGGIVHKALEVFYKGKFCKDLESAMSGHYNDAWEAKKEDLDTLGMTPEELQYEKEDGALQLYIYMIKFRMKMDMLMRCKKASSPSHAYYLLKPKFRELWLEDKDLNLCRFIDKVYKDFDGNLILGDFKTSQRYVFVLKTDYKLQTGIYALLYHRCKGIIPDGVSVIYLRFGDEVVTDVTPSMIKWALDILADVRSKTKTDDIEDYPMREQKLCKWCPWFNKCSGEETVNDDIRRKKILKGLKK